MENPQTGRKEMYKEYWTLPPTPAGADAVAKLPCIVAETMPTPQCPRRGRIIRVGEYIQAIMDASDDDIPATVVILERWCRTYSDGHPRWSKDNRCQTTILPISWVCEDSLVVGNEIEQHGVRWKTTEVVR